MFNQHFILTLKPSLILEAVKAETFIKGKVDKGALNNAEAMVFNEQAGDDVFHERKLASSIYNAVEELCSLFSEYAAPEVLGEEDSITHDVDIDGDNITIDLSLSYRVNPSFVTTLTRLSQKYVVTKVTYDWFLAFDPKQAQFYNTEKTVVDIRVLFNRRPPVYPCYPYVTKLSCDISAVEMDVDDSYTFSYETYGGQDDITYSYTGSNLSITHDTDAKTFTITGNSAGVDNLYLYSKHDDSIYTTIKITVND